ncbi:MAG TPA: hypothetical protein VJ933_08050, partial [Phaeodactylibacter sp.]|nr:hypothetical protein [Phaeodactylibacter sp.]
MRSLLFLLLGLGMAFQLSAQDNYWMDIEERNIFLPQASEVAISVKQYRTLRLKQEALQDQLERAPMEFTPAASTQASTIRLPLPDGRTATF